MKILTIVNSILLLILLSLIGLPFAGFPIIKKPVPFVQKIDTAYIMQKLRTIEFETKKAKTVYVPKVEIQRIKESTEKQSIVNYYYDSTVIVNNNEIPVSLKLTQDTVRNDDGEFYLSAISETPLLRLGLDYKLKTPVITKLITPHQIFAVASFGTNSQKINLSTGLMYVNPNGFGLKYEYEYIDKFHNVGVVFPLKRFNLK